MEEEGSRRRTEALAAAALADKLVVEILARLPAKSLRRFSCVSRAWRALISDPANRRRFAQTLSGLFFSRPSCSRPRWGFFTGLSAPPPPGVDTALSFLPPTCGEVELLDSCNGLLLLRCAGAPESPSPPFYVVCNPATGEHVALPQPSRAPGLNDGITDTYSAALGFDPAVSSNFHVFQLLQEHCLDLSLFIVAVEIYSSETGTWVFKESGWSEDDTRFNGQMTYFNGSLHFCNVSNAVVSVDTKGQAWRVSRVRHDAAYYGYGSSIGHSQGRLIYVAHNDSWSSSLSVYVLEDHDSEEWMWTFKQDIKKLDLFGPRSREWEYYIAGFHPNDDLVFFYFWPQKRLLSYNMKRGDVRVICTLREVLKLVHEGCFDLRRLFLPYVPLYSGALSARNASQPSAQGSNLASISLEGADELN